MKKFVLFSIFIMISCKSVDSNLSGNYKTHKSSYTEKWMNYFTNKCNILGVELSLSQDSTFTIKTCSYNGNGKWTTKNDSLVLNYINQKIYTESTKSYKNVENASELHERFLIKNNCFIQKIKTENDECIVKLTK